MKNKIVFILLLININVLGQSVPNTETFTLQNVIDVVNPTTDDLSDCFSDSNAAYFDPNYGSKTMNPQTLYGFRNYGITYSCSNNVSTGAAGWPTSIRINLGSSSGTVNTTYDMYDIPDLMIIKYDGSVVANTGFRGNSDFDYGGSDRNVLIVHLAGKTDPIYGSTFPDFTHYTEDGYPRIVGGGSGSISFSKTTSTVFCYVELYTYGGGWVINVDCP